MDLFEFSQLVHHCSEFASESVVDGNADRSVSKNRIPERELIEMFKRAAKLSSHYSEFESASVTAEDVGPNDIDNGEGATQDATDDSTRNPEVKLRRKSSRKLSGTFVGGILANDNAVSSKQASEGESVIKESFAVVASAVGLIPPFESHANKIASKSVDGEH